MGFFPKSRRRSRWITVVEEAWYRSGEHFESYLCIWRRSRLSEETPPRIERGTTQLQRTGSKSRETLNRTETLASGTPLSLLWRYQTRSLRLLGSVSEWYTFEFVMALPDPVAKAPRFCKRVVHL